MLARQIESKELAYVPYEIPLPCVQRKYAGLTNNHHAVACTCKASMCSNSPCGRAAAALHDAVHPIVIVHDLLKSSRSVAISIHRPRWTQSMSASRGERISIRIQGAYSQVALA